MKRAPDSQGVRPAPRPPQQPLSTGPCAETTHPAVGRAGPCGRVLSACPSPDLGPAAAPKLHPGASSTQVSFTPSSCPALTQSSGTWCHPRWARDLVGPAWAPCWCHGASSWWLLCRAVGTGASPRPQPLSWQEGEPGPSLHQSATWHNPTRTPCEATGSPHQPPRVPAKMPPLGCWGEICEGGVYFQSLALSCLWAEHGGLCSLSPSGALVTSPDLPPGLFSLPLSHCSAEAWAEACTGGAPQHPTAFT